MENRTRTNDVTGSNVASAESAWNDVTSGNLELTVATLSNLTGSALDAKNWTRSDATTPLTGHEQTALETALFASVLILLILWIYAGNILAMWCMLSHERFRSPGNYIKCAYAVNDIILNTVSNPHMLMVLMVPKRDIIIGLCRATSNLAITFSFSTMYMTTYIAIERYFYFGRPYLHQRFFTLRSIVCTTCVLIIVPFIWSTVTEIGSPRQLSTAVLLCQLEGAKNVIPVQIALFIVPSLLGIVYSMVMMFRLLWSVRMRVAPFSNQITQKNQQVDPASKSIKSGLRLIFLISGAYWGTYFPSWVIRICVLSTGATWEEIDSRVNITHTALIRVHVILLSAMASALNPIIYFATHRDLRTAALRLFGKYRQFSWEREMTEIVNQAHRRKRHEEQPPSMSVSYIA